MEIQHCAKITSSTKLSFVRACCSQKHLPYTFEVVDSHASFSEHSSYGVLEINHFSGYGNAVEGVAERNYIASLYYYEEMYHPKISRIHIVVTWNTDIHRKVGLFPKRVRINYFYYTGCGAAVRKQACSLGTMVALRI